jgi:hypothetical protein
MLRHFRLSLLPALLLPSVLEARVTDTDRVAARVKALAETSRPAGG